MSETQAAKDVGTIVERLLAGWPVYSVGLIAMWGYAELYLDRMISDAIKAETGQTQTVTEMQTAVALNTDAVNDLGDDVQALNTSVTSLNDDVKDTLRILATQ